VPRKYHRPPSTTTKRRKSRKSAIPYEFEAGPTEPVVDEEAADDGEGWEGEDIADSEGTAVAVEERPGLRSREPVVERDEHGRVERHVRRDYGFVRGEVVRIVVIGGFLIVSLIITSVLR
jgi:hypothetical protein